MSTQQISKKGDCCGGIISPYEKQQKDGHQYNFTENFLKLIAMTSATHAEQQPGDSNMSDRCERGQNSICYSFIRCHHSFPESSGASEIIFVHDLHATKTTHISRSEGPHKTLTHRRIQVPHPDDHIFLTLTNQRRQFSSPSPSKIPFKTPTQNSCGDGFEGLLCLLARSLAIIKLFLCCLSAVSVYWYATYTVGFLLVLSPRLVCSGAIMTHCSFDLLGSNDPSASTYQVTGIIDVNYCTWLKIDTTKRIRHITDWENIFAKDISDKGLLSKICNELLKPDDKLEYSSVISAHCNLHLPDSSHSPVSASRGAGTTGTHPPCPANFYIIIIFLVETGFHHVGQDGLDLLTLLKCGGMISARCNLCIPDSSNSPASASPVAGPIGIQVEVPSSRYTVSITDLPPFSSKFTLACSMQMDVGFFYNLPAVTMPNFVSRLAQGESFAFRFRCAPADWQPLRCPAPLGHMVSPGPSSCRAHNFSRAQPLQGMAASSTQQQQLTSLPAPWVEKRVFHVGQTGLEHLTSGDPPASQSAGITSVSRCAQSKIYVFLVRYKINQYCCCSFFYI
ncbi:hypothetical protein AAY473_014878 [Plecturocebus cupreus]